jgi:predicted DNA-binding protein
MKKRIHVHVEPEQEKSLRALSNKTGAPVAELIRRAISAYLKLETGE